MPERPRILVVADESLIAFDIEGTLTEANFAVACIAMNAADALDCVSRETFDAAILDVVLADGFVWPVADALRAEGTPFVLLTGMNGLGVPPEHSTAPMISKPFNYSELIGRLSEIIEQRRSLSACEWPRRTSGTMAFAHHSVG